MKPLEFGTLIFSAATLGAVVVAVNTKDKGRRALLYNIAAGTGVSAMSTYIFALAEAHRDMTDAMNARTSVLASLPPSLLPASTSMLPIPNPRQPFPSPPGAGPTPAPPASSPAPAPAPSPSSAVSSNPGRIGCTPLSGALPASAVAQARSLLALDPASTDVRYQPSRESVNTMRQLANDLRGCGSSLGFQPIRDALVKDLEDTATRFEIALGSAPPAPSPAPTAPPSPLANVLRSS